MGRVIWEAVTINLDKLSQRMAGPAGRPQDPDPGPQLELEVKGMILLG